MSAAATSALAADPHHLGQAGGRLYAANTGGAIVGTLLTAFLLIASLVGVLMLRFFILYAGQLTVA